MLLQLLLYFPCEAMPLNELLSGRESESREVGVVVGIGAPSEEGELGVVVGGRLFSIEGAAHGILLWNYSRTSRGTEGDKCRMSGRG